MKQAEPSSDEEGVGLYPDSDCEDAKNGLRTISERVLQVLLENKQTTYKAVSDMVTKAEL